MRLRLAALAAALLLAGAGVATAASDDDCLLHCPTHRGSFGSPEPDKECVLRCLSGGPSTPSENVQPPRFSKSWDESAALKTQREALETLLERIPDKRFRDWAKRSVLFERASQGDSPTIGVQPGKLTIYDTFWKLKDADQMNTLLFELGKVLWFERINPGPPEARPPKQIEFETLYWQHQATIEAMKSARFQGKNLASLGDSDMQSWFAYACRAMALDLGPPPIAAKDWAATRASTDRFISELLAAR